MTVHILDKGSAYLCFMEEIRNKRNKEQVRKVLHAKQFQFVKNCSKYNKPQA